MINLATLAAMSTICMEAATFGSPVVHAAAVQAAAAEVTAAETGQASVTAADASLETGADAEVEGADGQSLTTPPAEALTVAPVSNTADNLILEEEQFAGPLAFEGESDDAVVERLVAYLEGVDTLKGDFTQIAPSGSVSTGRFFLRRPGLLRFEYDPPTPLLIVANSGLVYVRDEDLETTDSYPVGRTPLKFLLSKKLDLESAEVIAVDRGVDSVAVTLASTDDETEGELSIIVSAPEMSLERWIVRDLQNGITVVTLANVAAGERLANRLFRAPEAGGQFLKN